MFHIPSIAQKPTGARLWAFTQGRWAIVWMCRNQLGRRNLTDVQRTLLIGEAYRAQKMTQGAADGFRGNQYTGLVSAQNGNLPKQSERTVQKIAKDFGVGKNSVKRAEMFADGLDAAEAVSAGFKDAVRSGAVTAPKYVIQEIGSIPEAHLPAAVEAIKSGDIDTAKEIIQQSKPEPTKKETPRDSSSRALSCPQTKDRKNQVVKATTWFVTSGKKRVAHSITPLFALQKPQERRCPVP